MAANAPPKVGNPSFAIVASNAPRSSAGFCVASDVQDLTGSDPLFLGITLQIGILSATELHGFPIVSDPSGAAFAPAPIPNNPALAGKTFYVQSFWVQAPGMTCSPAVAALVSSRGLSVTLQP